jgi:predicted DNA-binding transcriptional regulator AlpA
MALSETDARALAEFDNLPTSALVALPVVAALYSTTPHNVWKWVKTGRVPTPRKIGPQATRWVVGELRQSLAALAEAVDG